MSALGQKRTLGHVRAMSALPPKADIGTQPRDVRFVPKADSCIASHHSNTSSARTRTDGGIAIPNALAVLAFTASSNLVGCSTGRSAGFMPLRTLTTIIPACRHIDVRLIP